MALMGGGDLSSSALRFSRTRGRIGGAGDYGLQYPSPFFDIGQTYLPATVKQMFRWCRYYYLVNPLINTVASKMAEYPVTDILLDTERMEHKERWAVFLGEQLRYRAFQIEVGLDYYVYGNALVSIFYPFVKILICKNCNFEKAAADSNYRFMNFEFHWNCPQCGEMGPCKVRDHYVKAPKGIRLIRWNPEDVDIRYNDINGEYEYYYTIPVQLRNDIIIGKKSAVETVPQLFIDALRLKKAVVFSRDNIFHFKRPTLAGKDRGWGTPLILPVMKDCYYLQILRKAQECVSLDSLIETESGLVQANDVRVGDMVRTHTGLWQPVEDKWYRDSREDEIGKKITLSGLRPLPTTYSPHHPIFSLRRNEEGRRSDTKDSQISSVILRNPHLYEEVLCPAEQLHVGDYVLYPSRLPVLDTSVDVAKYTGLRSTEGWVYSGCGEQTARAFEALERGEHVEHDNAGRVAKRTMKEGRTPKRMEAARPMTEDLAYILGWYAGDGSCGARHVQFTTGKKDDPTRLITAIKTEFGVDATVEVGESVDTVVLSDVIVRHLIKGMIPGTARDKRAPREVLDGTDKLKLAYLRGLWEADGSSDLDRATLATGSKNQAYDAYRMLLHFGCVATVGSHETPDSVLPTGRVIRGGTHYHAVVCSASKDRFVSLLRGEQGQKVTSGKSGFFWKEYFASRIHAIEDSEEDQYIDFKVKTDTTFCAPGTATKNSIALEHIVPLRVLFPQAGSSSSDPYSSVNLADWRDQVASEIRQWRSDNAYIPIMSLPIGQQTIGGDGRALLLSQEIRVWSEHIIAGMGVPVELIFGGLSYSGSNVSMRMLENMHLGYLTDHRSLLKWVIEHISSYLGWAPVKARFKPFKMADDLQRKAYNFQLNQAGKVSDETLLADSDLDAAKEDQIMEIESARRANATKKQKLLQAEIEGEAAMVTAKWQNKAQVKALQEQTAIQTEAAKEEGAFQTEMQKDLMQTQMAAQTGQEPPSPSAELQPSPRNPHVLDMPKEVKSPLTLSSIQQVPAGATVGDIAGSQNVDILLMARKIADRIAQVPQPQQQEVFTKLQTYSPELHDAVLGLMSSGSNGPSRASAASARPLPQQRAPRRGPEAGLV